MPASLPGATVAENLANPSQGKTVTFDPLSGPKGAPFDARKITGWSGTNPVYVADATNLSTGGLSTGIGFGATALTAVDLSTATKPSNFTDDQIPGQELPNGTTASAVLMYIGGGRSNANGTPNPYVATSMGLCAAGNGGSRDAAGNVGFGLKLVTAAASIANGSVVETGFVNRTGVTLATGQSTFGSASAAMAAPTVAATGEQASATPPTTLKSTPHTTKAHK